MNASPVAADQRLPVAPLYWVSLVCAALALCLILLPHLTGPLDVSGGVTMVQPLVSPVPAPTPNPQPITAPIPTLEPRPVLSRAGTAPIARTSSSGIVEATCAGVRPAPRQHHERASANACGAR